MEIIIFQLLYCLYLYDSSIGVPVGIRKQNLYTGFQPGAFRTVPPVYGPLACGVDNRASGIPSSGGCVDIPCRRYTSLWCSKGQHIGLVACSTFRLAIGTVRRAGPSLSSTRRRSSARLSQLTKAPRKSRRMKTRPRKVRRRWQRIKKKRGSGHILST